MSLLADDSAHRPRPHRQARRATRTLLALAALALAPLAVHALADSDLPESLRPGYVDPVIGPSNDQAYAHGNLGLLRTTYGRASLYVAYRVMHLPVGAVATESHRRQGDWVTGPVADPNPNAPDPIRTWLDARGAVVKTDPAVRPDYFRHRKTTLPGVDGQPGYEMDSVTGNCGPDAFAFATKTLQQWGADATANDADRRTWIAGQDAVFAQCAWTPGAGKAPALPSPLAARAAPRMKALRAYQHAAALFYAGDYEHARLEFDALAATDDLALRGWARLGALRAVLRDAVNDTAWEKAWQDAYVRRQLRGDALDAAVADDVVRHRTRAVAAIREIETRGQAITDDPQLEARKPATWYTLRRAYMQLAPASILLRTMNTLDHLDANPYQLDTLATWNELYRQTIGEHPAPAVSAQLRQHAYFDWTATIQACNDFPKAANATACDAEHVHAMTRWKETGTNDWLLASLMTARQPAAADLPAAEAARAVAQDRPEWASIQLYAARALRAQGRQDDARALLKPLEAISKTFGKQDRALLNAEAAAAR